MWMIAGLREQASRLKGEVIALYLAMHDPRTPWLARWLAALVVGYAVSPVDLIPDFVPLLSYVDDLVLLPLGIWLVLRLIPDEVMADCRRRAAETEIDPTVKRVGATVTVMLWIVALALLLIAAVV
jgi:uncharacterized membrane protein YkvA (DUF1232 family)